MIALLLAYDLGHSLLSPTAAPMSDIWSGGHVPIIGPQSLTVQGGQNINFEVPLYWDPGTSTLGFTGFKMELSADPIQSNDPPSLHDIPEIDRADTLKPLGYNPLNQTHPPMSVDIRTTVPQVTTTIHRRLIGYRGSKVVGKWLYPGDITLVAPIMPPINPVLKVFLDEVTPPAKIVVYVRTGGMRGQRGSFKLLTSNEPSGVADPPRPTVGVVPDDWSQSVEAARYSSWTRAVIRTAPTDSDVRVYFTVKWRNGLRSRTITSKVAVTVRGKNG